MPEELIRELKVKANMLEMLFDLYEATHVNHLDKETIYDRVADYHAAYQHMIMFGAFDSLYGEEEE